ncbi:MAG: hypothetical protein E5X27_16440, partial [Mesorhizobium sp.]
MKLSALPAKFPVAWGASASPSYIRSIPLGSQIGIVNGAASLTDGFPPLNFLPVGSGGVPPFGQDINGILQQITQWSQWQNAGGLVPYDPAFSAAIGGYPKSALLAGAATGVVWLSTADDNTSDPDTSGANWVNIGAASAPIMVGTDAGSANVCTATVLPGPSAYVDGQIFVVQKAAFDNNGAMTGNIDGLGTHPIVNMDGTALTAKQWPGSATGILEFNNATTSFRLLNPAVTVAANAGLAATDQQVLSLSITSLPAPTGALSLNDSLPLHVVSDGADREVTLAALATILPGAMKAMRVMTAEPTRPRSVPRACSSLPRAQAAQAAAMPRQTASPAAAEARAERRSISARSRSRPSPSVPAASPIHHPVPISSAVPAEQPLSALLPSLPAALAVLPAAPTHLERAARGWEPEPPEPSWCPAVAARLVQAMKAVAGAPRSGAAAATAAQRLR